MKIVKEFKDCNYDLIEEKVFKSRSNYKEYNKFKNISIEQLKQIITLADNFKKTSFEKLRVRNYRKVLQYLSTGYGKTKLLSTRGYYNDTNPSYDENMAFVIAALDPTCELFKAYISCESTMKKFDKESIARNKIGFFSKILLEAEKDYYFKYINKLLTNVNEDNTKYLSLLCKMFRSFDNLEENRLNELKDLSIIWNKYTNDNSKFQTCIYNLLHQSDLLSTSILEEKLAFFINCVDPELKILDIYEEECTYPRIEARIKEEFGYYLKDLINLEKEYKSKFIHNKQKKYKF